VWDATQRMLRAAGRWSKQLLAAFAFAVGGALSAYPLMVGGATGAVAFLSAYASWAGGTASAAVAAVSSPLPHTSVVGRKTPRRSSRAALDRPELGPSPPSRSPPSSQQRRRSAAAGSSPPSSGSAGPHRVWLRHDGPVDADPEWRNLNSSRQGA